MSIERALKFIDEMGMTPAEITDLLNTLIRHESKKSRGDAATYADLLVSTVRVARYDDSSIISGAELLLEKIRKANQC